MRTVLIPLILTLIATPALATDGVLEINQTCAVETGCFPGDTPGLPVLITEPGSYRLTSNLIVPNEDTDGIFVRTSDVGIDLNNFAIIRSGCEGVTLDCTPRSGTGAGVRSNATELRRGVSVKNGSITAMGNSGVLLGAQSEVTNLRVRWNRIDGITVNAGSTVTGNTAFRNGRNGMKISSGSTASGNTVWGNGSHGIETTTGCSVKGNTVRDNEGSGLKLGLLTGYRENVISGNIMGEVSGGVDAGANVVNGVVTPTP